MPERLKDFPAKTNPVATDIMYVGDVSDDYNEVKSTTTQIVQGARPASITMAAGSTSIQTNTANNDTVLLRAYDVDGTSYVTFITATAANTPTCDLSDSVTKAGGYIYRAGGTDVPITDGGTGASDAAVALTNLGGQPLNATLTAIANTIYSTNSVVYASSTNNLVGLVPNNGSVLVTNSSGVPVFSSTMSDGEIIIGSTGATPVKGTIQAGSGIQITNGAGTITITNTGENMAFENVTATTKQMSNNTAYLASSDNINILEFTLPMLADEGTYIELIGKGAGGWVVYANASQFIRIGDFLASGSVSSTSQYDTIRLICTSANTRWDAIGAPQGQIDIDVL